MDFESPVRRGKEDGWANSPVSFLSSMGERMGCTDCGCTDAAIAGQGMGLPAMAATGGQASAESTSRPVQLNSRVTHVQPMTGIVLWDDNEHVKTDAIALEYRYCGYDEVVGQDGRYDWSLIERVLDAIAGRGHQAILRFYFVYPGRETTVPLSIKKLADYQETIGTSEGQETHFCDWRHPALQEFVLDFTTQFSRRYDRDPRLAFLQVGFGLWAEYHIYDGPLSMGQTFPSKAFQIRFLQHLNQSCASLPWSISVDAADSEYTPLADSPELLRLNFGLFDDSFLCKEHAKVNALNWRALGENRWQRAPAGGEFSYYTKRDQKQALSDQGPNGEKFESAAARFHLSYIIGSDQPDYQPMQRIAAAGQALGYRFRVTEALLDPPLLKLRVENVGIAPIYRDAYFEYSGKRSAQSLRSLLPGSSLDTEIHIPADKEWDPTALRIQCEHLVAGQEIQFEAALQVRE